MHRKSDSEATSLDASSPPRSPRRPLYFVQSPSQHDAEKMSYGWSPMGTPHHYHCSPIHHSRESSSTSRFSASLNHTRSHIGSNVNINNKNNSAAPWKKLGHRDVNEDDDDEDDGDGHASPARVYVLCFVILFVVLFSLFSLILWAASKPYKPKITMEKGSRGPGIEVSWSGTDTWLDVTDWALVCVQSILFEKYNIQAGIDNSGVPTDMLSLKSTVRILYRNPATFFGVHVTFTPLDLYYYQLKVASGHMDGFYQSRKSERRLAATIQGHQVPVYGGVSVLSGKNRDGHESASVPLNLTFVIRSRAYILGRLVKPKFYAKVRCLVTLSSNHLGKHSNLKHSCSFD
ncbi:hypothetical protein Sjap_009812 [Stephania japonica]|uniref:Late embryogenesis abundant protein LEA-2 subgroup domain-containing protein n=1 Tax=Stephania japonica TaxID=461633 RepID=A0AAP0P5T8_9MAGN